MINDLDGKSFGERLELQNIYFSLEKKLCRWRRENTIVFHVQQREGKN